MNRDVEKKIKAYERKHLTRRKRLSAVVSLCLVVAFVTSYILINPADTKGSVCYCGYEEHTEHVKECYSQNGELICEKPLHEHTLQCFSDPEADKEDAGIWEKGLERAELTGNIKTDIIAVAETQLGYTESIRNYTVYEEDSSIQGYTRYGEWYGDPYGEWDAMFCSYCLYYAGVEEDIFPFSEDSGSWVEKLSVMEMFALAENVIPSQGDLVFFDRDNDGTADHVGLVAEVTEATENDNLKIDTIEADLNDCVNYGSYYADDMTILGYGLLPFETETVTSGDTVITDTETAAPTGDDLSSAENIPGNENIQKSEDTDDRVAVSVTYDSPEAAGLKLSSAKAVTGNYLMMIGSAKGEEEGGEPQPVEPLDVEDYIPSASADYPQPVKLEYSTEDDPGIDDWIDVTTLSPEETIPGDASLRINIDFAHVNIHDLAAHGYRMSYIIPDIMRNPIVSEIITSGNTVVGKLAVSDVVKDGSTVSMVTITFDEEWVNSQQMYKEIEDPENPGQTKKVPVDSFIEGDFWVRSDINLTKAEEMHPGTVHTGDVDITVNFEPKVLEKYSQVDILKSDAELSCVGDTWYLTYTLTVEAGEDGCPDISVKDVFGENNYVGAYEIVGATKQTSDDNSPVSLDISTLNITNGDILTWNIGDMAPNDIYTLTYRVPLSNDYIGGQAKDTIDNTATVYYDGTNVKSNDDSHFTPVVNPSINKTRSQKYSSIDTENGGYYYYTVSITVPEGTTYPLENVVIKDSLDGALSKLYITNPEIRRYLSYDTSKDMNRLEDRFLWCTTDEENLKETTGIIQDYEEEVIFYDTDNDGKYNDSFSVNIGTLYPGDTVYFRYKVKIDPGIFTEIGNDDGKIVNRAGIILDGDETAFKGSNCTATISHKQWSRKLGGEKYDTDLVISIDPVDGVYTPGTVGTDGKVIPLSEVPAAHPADNSFTVPAGSYLYRIVVNEAGDWDISSASMKDVIGKEWMQYQGYVRVDAYPITSPVQGSTDAEVIANMDLLPDEGKMTSWIKADGLTNFAFRPQDVFRDRNGQPISGDYAYLLTYYAKPVVDDDVSLNNVIVGNTFSMEGKVINGDTEYELTGIEAKADVVVQANTSFNAEKSAWYYANPVEEQVPNFTEYGALYWVVKADGVIDAGTVFNDYGNNNDKRGYYRPNSIEGIYIGKFGSKDLISYTDLKDLKASVNVDPDIELRALPETAYRIDYYQNKAAKTPLSVAPAGNAAARCEITMLEDVTLYEGESLYIIYRTAPDPKDIPKNNDGSLTVDGSVKYKNYLQTKLPDKDEYSDPQDDTLTLYNREYIVKQGYIGEYYDRNDGQGIRMVWSGNLPDYFKLNIPSGNTDGQPIKPGTYVGWYIKLDKWKNMNGRYRVIDQIPEGLTPEFVAMVHWDDKMTDDGYGNHSARIDASDLPTDATWTEHITQMKGSRKWYSDSSFSYADNTVFTFYWYTDENNRVLFELDQFVPDIKSSYAAQLMIGTRVSDPDVLMHGVQGDYTNTAELYDADGDKIDESGSNAKITRTTLEKHLVEENAHVNPVPFEIIANRYGEDLVPNSNSVQIIDTLSDNLTLNLSSITVKNLWSGELLSDSAWSVAVNGQSFTLTLPDGIPLQILYTARLDVMPETPVTIWNDAYWQGSAPPEKHIVEKEEYYYIGGGSASSNTPPVLEIIKNDANQAKRTLPDVPFELQKMIVTVYTDEETEEKSVELTVDGTFNNSEGAKTGATGTDGKLTFTDLEYNTVYRVRETAAPQGYYLDESWHYFIVARKTEDKPKLDQNGEPILNEQGNPVYEKAYPEFLELLNTTDKQDEEYIALQLSEDFGITYSLNIYDPPIEYELPETGGPGTKQLYILSVLLIAAALIYGYYPGHRRERRYEVPSYNGE